MAPHKGLCSAACNNGRPIRTDKQAKQTIAWRGEVVVINAIRRSIGKSGRKGMDKRGQLFQTSAQVPLADMLHGLLGRVRAKSPKCDTRITEEVIVMLCGSGGIGIATVASW